MSTQHTSNSPENDPTNYGIDEPQNGNPEKPSPPDNLVAPVAPRTCVRHGAGIMSCVSGFAATLTNAAVAFGDSLLAQNVGVFLPERTVAISFCFRHAPT